MSHSQHTMPPLIKELSEKMKEPLKTIKLLQVMNVLDEKPSIPPIIVLGEAGASAGSVISTLVGLNLPSDLGVTLVLKFTNDDSVQSRNIWLTFYFEDTYCEKQVSEEHLASEIEELVKPIPENKRSKIGLTLTVIQSQVSDLTIILLPDINTHYSEPELPWQINTRKEDKEIEVIRGDILRYTKDDYTCLFLNVLSCPTNINSYLYKKILKGHDWFGRNIVTVFTKPDPSSECMLTWLTSKNAIKAPFGYFFVDNTINEADDQETGERDMLSLKVDQDYIGFDVISKNIVIALLSLLFDPYSLILKRIKSDLKESDLEIKQSQKTFDSVSDAALEICFILNSINIVLHKLFMEQDYGEYWKDEYMHVASNIARQFRRFKIDLQDLKFVAEIPFLQSEIKLMNSGSQYFAKGFYTRSDIISLLDEQFSHASSTIDAFVSDVMKYIETVVVKVCLDCSKNHRQLRQPVKKVGRVLVEGVQESFEEKVKGMLDVEKNFLYTCDVDFDRKVNETKSRTVLELDVGKEVLDIDGIGKNIKVDHLKSYPADQVVKAFELKILIVVYWEYVVNRFVEYCSLNLQFLIREMTGVRISELVKQHFIKASKDESKLPDVEPMVAYNKVILENRTECLIEVMKDIEKWQVKDEDFV
ncbi:hypothetical protein QVD17_05858 [Tagetes erecta]|uniref:Dynamin stalk domain-containing protein n=1 Tax=Tagetes erecta TaxID=13708 RepID=A0AAD8LIB6_TARER|nr:hypothetical protein QVD17_05858 [Tagetes erecta]